MALVGSLAIGMLVRTAGLDRGLNRSAKMVDGWSNKVGKTADASLARLNAPPPVGKWTAGLNAISGGLGTIYKTADRVRTGMDVMDIGRVAARGANGVGRLRLAFMGSGDAADALRAKLDRNSSALNRLGEVSKKTRTALMWTQVGAFFGQLGVGGARFFGLFAKGALGVAAGAARMTVSLANVVMGAWDLGESLLRAVPATWNLVSGLAGIAVGSVKAALGMGKASGNALGLLKNLVKATFGALQLGNAVGAMFRIGRGLAGLVSGTAKVAIGFGRAAAGVVKFGTELAKTAWSAFGGAIKGVASAIASVGRSALSAASTVASFAAIGGALAAILGVKTAASAAHLNETFSKTKEVFGESADAVLKDADAMNKAFGTNRQTYLDAAAALGGQLKGAGYAEKDAAALSSQLAKLGADVAAFRDIPFDEAMTKISSGLSGETVPLKAFGVDVSEAAVKAEAARMGLVKYGEELDQSAKIQARLSVITKGLADDSGALAREVQSPANQMAEFWGRLATLGQTVGETFAPIVGGALEYINQALFMLSENWEGLKNLVVDFVSSAGATLMGWAGAVAEFFEIGSGETDSWTVALGVLTNAWQLLGIGFKAVVTVVTGGLTVILKNLAYLGSAIDWITKKITGDSLGVGAYLDRLGDKMADVAVKSGMSVAEAWDKPWASMTDAPEKLGQALTGVADKVKGAYASAGEGMRKAREELAKPVHAVIGAPTNTTPDKEKKAAKPFGEALKLGSADAASAILKSRYGLQREKDSTASNTKETAVAAKELVSVGKATLAAIRSQHNPIPVFDI